MDGNQDIKCTVSSCKYNNENSNYCGLKQIHVAPIDNCDTKTAYESMCSSYKCEK